MLITGTGFSSEQYKRFSDLLPNVDIIFAYAMTEIGQISLFNPKYHKELMKSKPKSCGKVAPETSLKVRSLPHLTPFDCSSFQDCQHRHPGDSGTEPER
jgi:long-subunit acyl-CoA synthetase (AMP-forming)